MRQFFMVMVIISITCTSCFSETYNIVQKVTLTEENSYEIKTMAGCCGCKAIFYNVIRNNKIYEQFVTETNCGLSEPTKHLFTLDTKGRVKNVKSLVAVTDSSFTLPLTEIDREAFFKLDSIYANWQSLNRREIIFADITGFREGERTHMPLGIRMATVSPK